MHCLPWVQWTVWTAKQLYHEQDQQYSCKARAVAMILLYITTLTPSLSHFPSPPSLQYHVRISTVFYEMSSLSLNWKFYKDRSFFTNLLLLSFQCPLHNCCTVVQIKHWTNCMGIKNVFHFILINLCFPGGSVSGKEPAYKCRRHKRCLFNPWVGRIPWRRQWQPTPLFLPAESHGHRGAWRAMVCAVIKSWTWLKQLSMHDFF